MTKRLTAILLTLCLLAGMGTSAFAVVEQNSPNLFEDISADGALLGFHTEGEYYKVTTRANRIGNFSELGNWIAPKLKTFVMGTNIKEIGSTSMGFDIVDFHPETIIMEGVERIGMGAFQGNTLVTKIVLSPNLKYIANGAFMGIYGITDLNFQDTVLETIGDEAFATTPLTTVILPGTIRSIGYDAFVDCPIETFIIKNGPTELGAAVVGGGGLNCRLNLAIHIPPSVTKIADGFVTPIPGKTAKYYVAKGSAGDTYAKSKSTNHANIIYVDANDNPTGETGAPATTTPPASTTPPTQPPVTPGDDGWIVGTPQTPTPEPAVSGKGITASQKVVGTGAETIVIALSHMYGMMQEGKVTTEIWNKNTYADYKYDEAGDAFELNSALYVKYNGELHYVSYMVKPSFDKTYNRNGTIISGRVTLNMPLTVTADVQGVKRTFTEKDMYIFMETAFHDHGTVADANNYYKYRVIRPISGTTVPVATTTPTAPAKTTKAVPTSSKVKVNGTIKSFEAYNIDSSNYFKLRDFAFVVNGTKKQFNVGWDGAKGAINMTSLTPYKVAGGEMKKGDGLAKTATLSTAKLYKDGKLLNLTAYTINGNTYFKLRDLAQAFNIAVTWDGKTNTVGVDTSKAYTN